MTYEFSPIPGEILVCVLRLALIDLLGCALNLGNNARAGAGCKRCAMRSDSALRSASARSALRDACEQRFSSGRKALLCGAGSAHAPRRGNAQALLVQDLHSLSQF